ncbi:M50 family metallopeptidase [Phytoactinopolyspora halotolerans]|uniref:M50 family metallopeptidase n=1 Tax=Phytoactinopolyspora halotolerans TaxID=1981512 RepID=A0A6L9SCQ3_9ACTN|nr:M50 family metallopeptidase [Phytoactinopolyspora halotolerans]NEE02857.1 M50 family metallopeptidase [Phytoactinopolyspora halotolerans]
MFGLDDHRLDETLASMEASHVLVVAVLAVGLAIHRRTWNIIGYPVTIVHEIGHALAAVVAGYRLHGITVNSDMSGATNFAGRGTFRVLWTLWWGYPAPAALGAALMWAVTEGWSRVALWALVGGLALTFLFSRSWHTVGVVLATGALLGLVAWFGEPWMLNVVVFALGWLMLVGSLRAWWAVTRSHVTRRGVTRSDAYLMNRRLRMLPGGFWLFTFLVVIGAAAFYGVTNLLEVLDVAMPG